MQHFIGLTIPTISDHAVLGLLRAVIGSIVFGALGGFLGWLSLKVLQRAGFFAYLAEKR